MQYELSAYRLLLARCGLAQVSSPLSQTINLSANKLSASITINFGPERCLYRYKSAGCLMCVLVRKENPLPLDWYLLSATNPPNLVSILMSELNSPPIAPESGCLLASQPLAWKNLTHHLS